MDNDILTRIIELFSSLLLEGIILGFIFQLISNKSQERQQQNLQTEMNNIEKQNKFNAEQIMTAIDNARSDLMSQVKESKGR